MNKTIIVIIVIAVIAIVAGGAYYLKTGTTPANSNMNGSTNTNTSNSNTTPQAQSTNQVDIQNFAFAPADITVKKGTSVTWTNKDSMSHTVTETDGKTGPSSGSLPNGHSYSFTFDAVGTYKYNCSIHPSMTGSVTVTE